MSSITRRWTMIVVGTVALALLWAPEDMGVPAWLEITMLSALAVLGFWNYFVPKPVSAATNDDTG